jgi:hypothetical protein
MDEHVPGNGPVAKTRNSNLAPNPYSAIANRALPQQH